MSHNHFVLFAFQILTTHANCLLDCSLFWLPGQFLPWWHSFLRSVILFSTQLLHAIFSIIHDFSLLFISFPLSISNSYFHFSIISKFFDLIYFFSLRFPYFFNTFHFFHIYKKFVPVDQFKVVKLIFFCIIFFNTFLSYFLFAGKAIIMLLFFFIIFNCNVRFQKILISFLNKNSMLGCSTCTYADYHYIILVFRRSVVCL